MRLIDLRLQNFRQHASTQIRFEPGLTGIVGPNGAGKSTLLESIAWAIYGSEAARGTNDTIRFSRAPKRARVEVELVFALGAHEYRVVRTLTNAEVFVDGGPVPLASTVGGATRYLQARLGMARKEFFNTYFTGQKELQFLATMGPADRGRFLSQVLGYERLKTAQDLARARRTELRHEITGLRAAMADPAQLAAALAAAEERVAAATQQLAAAEAAHAAAAEGAAKVAPLWATVQAARERYTQLSHNIQVQQREAEVARSNRERAEAELARIGVAASELAELRTRLEPLPSVSQKCERLSELARTDERRKGLVSQLADLATDIAGTEERVAKLAQAPALEQRYTAELSALRAAQAERTGDIEERKTVWLRDKQAAQSNLLNFRDRGHELKDQLREIREAGAEGKCPTCERPLGADFERVLGELQDQWVRVVQDGKWWKQRFAQLEAKPPDLIELEQQALEAGAEIDDRARKHTRCEAAVAELATVQSELEARRERQSALQAQLEEIPAGYDAAAHRAAEAQLKELRALENRAARLEETAGRAAEREAERAEAAAREASAAQRRAQRAAERDALAFSEQRFDELRERQENAAAELRTAELRTTELRGELGRAEEGRIAAAREQARLAGQQAAIAGREADLRHHNELDNALTELRGELNTQVRPELGEIASLFLAQLTDGRYTALEIDESYNILVLDEGEEKPVISGGEEDVANLVLRLSLSQMIAERAGYPFSLLILDEVFGSLDVERRDNVVQLLRRLEDRFEQVILITHVEGIRENVDRVLRVEFDPRTGSSVVREEGQGEAGLALSGVAAG